MNYSLQNLIVPKDEKAYPQVMSNSTKDFMADTSKKYDQGSLQFSSVAQSCPTLCDPMNCSTPGLPVHHKLPEFTQTQVHRVSDAWLRWRREICF